MISAKTIKDLEKKGFRLEFPGYESDEEEIIEILKEDNPRLNLAIPLLLKKEFDYNKIINSINSSQKKEFRKIILISDNLFRTEGIDNRHLQSTIKKQKIREALSQEEIAYFHDSFKASLKNLGKESEDILKEQIQTRGNLNLNQALSKIFSPGKMRIMEKIFNHEPLTNTELKYYYRSIRPLILAILNENMKRYVRIIESTKKYD